MKNDLLRHCEPDSVTPHVLRGLHQWMGMPQQVRHDKSWIASSLVLLTMTACNPTVKVEAPDKPIEINLNVKIEQHVKIEIEKDVKKAIEKNKDIF